jgi:hypothetical protein
VIGANQSADYGADAAAQPGDAQRAGIAPVPHHRDREGRRGKGSGLVGRRVLVNPGWVKTDMGDTGAALTPTESVTTLKRLIETFGRDHSGRFFHYDGRNIPGERHQAAQLDKGGNNE